MINLSDVFNTVKGKLNIDDSKKQTILAGSESSNGVLRSAAETATSDIEATVGTALAALSINADTGVVDNSISDANIAAARSVATAAIDPVRTLLGGIDRQPTSGAEDKVYGTLTPTLNNFDGQAVRAAVEAFKNVDVAASMYFSIAYQAVSLKQDAVSELFYPIFVVDPAEAAIKIDVTTTSILTPVKRSGTGAVQGNYKKSLLKELRNPASFTLDANRIYPVVRAETAANLFNPAGVSGISSTITVGDGYDITTAPVKVNTEVDLLDLSITDELLAKGTLDHTDMLNKFLGIDKLYFSMVGADADGTEITEYFVKDISTLPAKFIETPNGNKYDLQLNYKNESLAFVGGDLGKTDGSDTAIVKLGSLAAGHYAKIAINIKGDANVESRLFVVNPITVSLVGVYDAAGNAVAETSTEYTDVKAVVDTIKLDAVLPEAYATNDNLRFKATRLDSTTNRYVYTMQRRHVLTEVVPVNGGGSDVSNGITAFVNAGLSFNGLNELSNAMSIISNLSVDTEDFGMASEYFTRGTYSESFDIATIVDGKESTNRVSDVEQALRLKIKTIATKLATDSNYFRVFNAISGVNTKPTVLIGTDLTIGSYINNFEDDMFKYVVARSVEDSMNGVLYISFGTAGKERNSAPSILNFGVCGWSPEVTLAAQTTEGGRTAYETLHIPTYRHQTILPILGRLDISGFEAIAGKLTTNFHTV